MPQRFKPTLIRQITEGLREGGLPGFVLHALVPGEHRLFPAELVLAAAIAASVKLNEKPDAGSPSGVRTVKVRASAGTWIGKSAASLVGAADGSEDGRIFIGANEPYLELPWWQDEVHALSSAGGTLYVIGSY